MDNVVSTITDMVVITVLDILVVSADPDIVAKEVNTIILKKITMDNALLDIIDIKVPLKVEDHMFAMVPNQILSKDQDNKDDLRPVHIEQMKLRLLDLPVIDKVSEDLKDNQPSEPKEPNELNKLCRMIENINCFT
ncbi:putative orfan [Tupanvirus soda lake]|uniref:Orfan n=2 Tax=Tupanvirus TaxID=2094720 RepID=A0AC62ABJ0_9VIRU|nr:putative orfan [Tupanvirus soda lake]QKU35028.1 putative orfan [Tupanvirus soda lake]